MTTTFMPHLDASNPSAESFMGTDTRSIEAIIADDAKELSTLGVSLESIARALNEAFEKSRSRLGSAVMIRPGVRARFYESMGRIPSPFGDGLFEKGEVVITDVEKETNIVATQLSIHLIRTRGFFEGKGSHFRVEPKMAVEMLGLVKD